MKGTMYLVLILLSACLISSCDTHQPAEIDLKQEAAIIHQLNDQLTEAMVQDGFSPPVASRNYAYPNIAAYEVLRHFDDELSSLSGQLTDLGELPQPTEGVDLRLAAVVAFCETAKNMVYRDYLIDDIQEDMMVRIKEEIRNADVAESSISYGEEVSNAIVEWSSKDNYKETRNKPLYEVSTEEGHWKPTPPTYSDAIEPHWRDIRPMMIENAQQFTPKTPAEFSKEVESDFHKLAIEVYDVVNNIDEDQLDIAKYWDCNPMVSINQGHLMYVKRQLTPGGHWMGITRTACKIKELDLVATSEIYTRLTVVMFDAFISCWDEKYRSDVIRPETYINEYIDDKWRPVLETPMFPEHTSGHSVVSASCAIELTNFFGDQFAYIDSVNFPFGLPPRNFGSFIEASEEAAVSRLYGGIHYMPAIDYGVEQGRNLGRFVSTNLVTRKPGQSDVSSISN